MKKILLVLNTAMKQRKLNLKGSRVRKAQEEITKIVNRDSLLSLQKRCKEALLRQKELQSSSQVRRLQKEHTRLKKRLKKLQKRREISVSRMESQKSKHMENQKKIEDQKKQIEKNVRETTGKNLKILL